MDAWEGGAIGLSSALLLAIALPLFAVLAQALFRRSRVRGVGTLQAEELRGPLVGYRDNARVAPFAPLSRARRRVRARRKNRHPDLGQLSL